MDLILDLIGLFSYCYFFYFFPRFMFCLTLGFVILMYVVGQFNSWIYDCRIKTEKKRDAYNKSLLEMSSRHT
jgi:hypothetical protein